VNFKIILTTRFEKEAKKIARVYPQFKTDIEALLESLSSNPVQGSHLGHGIYKVRIQITGKPTGKRYGAIIACGILCSKGVVPAFHLR